MSNIEYVHGCLSDNSAILGINDQVDTVDGAYDFMRKILIHIIQVIL